MKVTMIGHASVLLETSNGGILIDPWLSGPVLNNSWALLEPTAVPVDLWDRVKWIWFSHEHPDHFHPASVLSIPPEVRQRVLVLFQKTRDGKVRDWLRKNQFRVEELSNTSTYPLGKDTSLYLEMSGTIDSWIVVRDQGKTFADLNDCAVMSHVLAKAAKRFPGIDVLMTQFSYASWPGNPDDVASHRLWAKRYLDKLGEQVRLLKPRAVFPAASFVRFCHVENAWMNASRVTVAEAVRCVEEAGATPVVLVPGETWQISEAKDNRAALDHYANLSSASELHSHPTVDEVEIEKNAEGFAARLRSRNNVLLMHMLKMVLGFLKPVVFFLTDRKVAVRVDPLKGATFIRSETAPYDIALHSSALSQMLSQPWGLDTLNVSGRFRIRDGASIATLHDSFNIATLNSAGIYVRFSSLLSVDLIMRLALAGATWYRWKREIRVAK